MEKTLAELVAMPTISHDLQANMQALDYIQKRLAAAGMYCSRYVYHGHGVLLATSQPDARQAKVTLYGHSDVVPATEKAFRLRRQGNKLFGRGTYDMKYALATYIHLAESLRGSLHEYDFGIVIVSNEEGGGTNGIAELESFLAAEDYRTEICLMPDGARDWDIEYAAKGWWRFELTATGKSAHASRPWEGESASFKLIQALHELRQHFANTQPDTDTLNIGKIHGEGAYNQLPVHMAAWVEIRLSTDASAAANQILVDALCKKYDVTYRTDVLAPILRQDTTHPLMHAYKTAVEKITGYRPQERLSLGGSDAAAFNARGVSCIITYLPGGGHHSEKEWISRPDFLQFLPVVQEFIAATTRLTAPVDGTVQVAYNTAHPLPKTVAAAEVITTTRLNSLPRL